LLLLATATLAGALPYILICMQSCQQAQQLQEHLRSTVLYSLGLYFSIGTCQNRSYCAPVRSRAAAPSA
jgi:hypothetical protein